MKELLFVLFLLLSGSGFCQLKLISGTNLKIHSGTNLQFSTSDTLEVESGAYFENDGIITLPNNFFVLENPGFPIFGSGKELISFTGNTLTSTEPGHLGFQFISTSYLDTATLERFHDTLPGSLFSTVKRYFRLLDKTGNFITVHDIKLFADTTEYINPAIEDWHIMVSDLSTYQNYGADSSGSIFAFNNDTVFNYSYFSLSPLGYYEYASTTHAVCLNDSIKIDIDINGPFSNNSEWIAELSDANGNFVTLSAVDTSLLNNQNLHFSISTNGLISSPDYKVRIRIEEPSWNFELSPFVINELPLVPVISVLYDSLSTQSYPGTNIQWFLDGNPISGATDSILIAFANGNYTAEFTNVNGCFSNSTIIFNSLGLDEQFNYTKTQIYPNPGTNFFIIENTSFENLFSIYNSVGQIVYSSHLQYGKNIVETHESIFPQGIYYIKIGFQIFKFIKE